MKKLPIKKAKMKKASIKKPKMKRKSVKNMIPEILRLKNEGFTNKQVADILEVNLESMRTAIKRHKKEEGMPPKEKIDRSSLAGPLGFNLKRILREKPSLTYKQLSEAIRPYCKEGINPPSRESIRRFLVRNGIVRDKVTKRQNLEN